MSDLSNTSSQPGSGPGPDGELTLEIAPETMRALRELAARELRTPEAQALWLISRALTARVPGRLSAEERRERMELVTHALQRAYTEAGMPSLRTLTRRMEATGFRLSHTTVHSILRGRQAPSLAQLEALAGALDADVPALREMWKETAGNE